jgi:MFS family permease
MHEPPYRRQPSDDFSLWDFIRRAPRAHFGRFVFYSALIQVGGGATTPFLDWYLLRQLGYSTMDFAGLFTVQMLALYGFSPLVGRIGDRVGSKRVLGAGGLALVAVPPLLMVSTGWPYLLAVQVLDGAAWAAFSISAANYVYDIVTPAKRARCIAYYTLFTALSAAAGLFAFAAVAQFVRVPLTLAGATIAQPYVLILLCVMAVRLAANVLLLRSFREWRLAPAA